MNVNLGPKINLGAINSARADSPRNFLAEAGLLLVVCILFWWFLISPKQAALNTQKTALATLQSQESQISSTVSSMNSLLSTLNNSTDKITQLEQALPLSGNPLEFQLLVQSIAQSSGVGISNVNVSPSVAGEIASGDKALLANPYGATRSLQTLTGTAAVSGSFSQIMAFLQKMENSGRLIDVTSLSLNSGVTGELDLQAGFKGYYFAPLPSS